MLSVQTRPHSSTIRDILLLKDARVLTADRHATVYDVVELMVESNVGCVIVESEGDPLGIFTERDLLRRVVGAGKNPKSTVVSEVMSSPVEACFPEDDVRDCTAKLICRNFRHLAVAENGKIVGIISLRDLMALQLH